MYFMGKHLFNIPYYRSHQNTISGRCNQDCLHMGYNPEPVEVVVLPKTYLFEYLKNPSNKYGKQTVKLKVQPQNRNTSSLSVK